MTRTAIQRAWRYIFETGVVQKYYFEGKCKYAGPKITKPTATTMVDAGSERIVNDQIFREMLLFKLDAVDKIFNFLLTFSGFFLNTAQ